MKKHNPHKQYEVEDITQDAFERLLYTWALVAHDGKIMHLEKMSKTNMLKRKLVRVVE